ncbi:Uncharacterised protein [Enterobacter cloacae]|uniref:Uncharacterized protein n=1 Tax=Enterobacter cloacae TaxID=550 RepID=A0A377LVM0_ENTCL|nr:Uncharacterised protein [Enterobacter cloacae]
MIPPVPSKVGNISSSLLGFIRRFQSEGEGNNPLVQLNINIKTEFSRQGHHTAIVWHSNAIQA